MNQDAGGINHGLEAGIFKSVQAFFYRRLYLFPRMPFLCEQLLPKRLNFTPYEKIYERTRQRHLGRKGCRKLFDSRERRQIRHSFEGK